MTTPTPAQQLIEKIRNDLPHLRGHPVVDISGLPGNGVQFVCRAPPDSHTNWNLLSVCALSLARQVQGALLQFGHILLLKPTPQGVPRVAVGGLIQVWGGVPALSCLSKAIHVAERASLPTERTVYVQQGEFYNVNKNGAGVWHQTGLNTGHAPPAIPAQAGQAYTGPR